MSPHHVILVTYGEPPQADFLSQLLYSWRILLGLTRTVAPIPRPLLPLIAVARGISRRRLWSRQTYSSPLEEITVRQAEHLASVLRARAPQTDWRVRVAYEFRHPRLRVELDNIPASHDVTVVPMYAAGSAFTHELSRDVLAAWVRANGPRPAARVLPPLAPETLGAIASAFVQESVRGRLGFEGQDVALVLAAHGTLVEPPRPIDTGREATEQLCEAIRRRLAPRFGLVVNGWLNHTRGGRWTEPAIEDALKTVADAGFSRVVYFPYGFLADNAETQLEGRIALRAHPGLDALHVDSLNTFNPLTEALANQVVAEYGAETRPRRAC